MYARFKGTLKFNTYFIYFTYFIIYFKRRYVPYKREQKKEIEARIRNDRLREVREREKMKVKGKERERRKNTKLRKS